MNKIWLVPIWIVQVFSQSKSFTKNKVIGNVWLNRAGLHVLRLVLSHSVMRARMLLVSYNIAPDIKRAYFRDGFIVIPDFLSQSEFVRLDNEIRHADAEVRECTQGDTLTHRIMLDDNTLPNMPECTATLNRRDFTKLNRFASGSFSRPIAYIQTIKNHYIDGPPDPQKNLHSDTFHPTTKSWFFFDDVSERNGPFTYVPGSHRLTLKRLAWEYRKSISVSNDGDRYSANGSFRITDADAKAMDLAPPKAFAVAANTLVIANTHGFHCRGNASERSSRTELWTISRSNPFSPFPGIDHPLVTRVQNKAVGWWRRHLDKKAENRGAVSSWHIIAARNTVEDTEQHVTDRIEHSDTRTHTEGASLPSGSRTPATAYYSQSRMAR